MNGLLQNVRVRCSKRWLGAVLLVRRQSGSGRPAILRRARFTEAESGKAAATSGSRTTTFVPSAYRLAYLPRTPPRKSYSGRMVSGSDTFSGFFFIDLALKARRRPGIDKANRIAICVGDNNQSLPMRCPNREKPRFTNRMVRIRHRH